MKKLIALLSFVAVLAVPKVLASVISVGQIVHPTIAIASGQTTSGSQPTNGMQLVGCQLPAAFTGTQISFTVATTATGTYQELDNSSGQVKYTVAQGKFIAINPADFAGVQFFKIVSGSSEGGARSLVCAMKGI